MDEEEDNPETSKMKRSVKMKKHAKTDLENSRQRSANIGEAKLMKDKKITLGAPLAVLGKTSIRITNKDNEKESSC